MRRLRSASNGIRGRACGRCARREYDGLVFYLSQLYSYDSDWYLRWWIRLVIVGRDKF